MSTGAEPAAASNPICSGVARRTSTPMSGSASRVTIEPNCDTAWPVHSRMKSRWRHRLAGGGGLGVIGSAGAGLVRRANGRVHLGFLAGRDAGD